MVTTIKTVTTMSETFFLPRSVNRNDDFRGGFRVFIKIDFSFWRTFENENSKIWNLVSGRQFQLFRFRLLPNLTDTILWLGRCNLDVSSSFFLNPHSHPSGCYGAANAGLPSPCQTDISIIQYFNCYMMYPDEPIHCIKVVGVLLLEVIFRNGQTW